MRGGAAETPRDLAGHPGQEVTFVGVSCGGGGGVGGLRGRQFGQEEHEARIIELPGAWAQGCDAARWQRPRDIFGFIYTSMTPMEGQMLQGSRWRTPPVSLSNSFWPMFSKAQDLRGEDGVALG